MSETNEQEFYDNLKEKLDDTTEFPSEYMYKFIMPNENQKMAEVQSVFDNANPEFAYRESKSGKFLSITVMVYVLDSDTIIDYYKRIGKIDGVIML